MNEDFWDKLLACYHRSPAYPETHNCPRGCESGQEGKAVWTEDESCSFCGSLHPDVLMARIEAGDVTLEPTDKNYKLYVNAAGSEPFKQTFRGDGDSGGGDPAKWVWATRDVQQTKFYFQHLSADQKKRFVELLNAKKLKLDVPGYFYRLPFFIEKDGA